MVRFGGSAGPSFRVRVQVCQDEIDFGLRGGPQGAVEIPFDGRGGPAGAGAKVDKGVRRQGRAEVTLEKGGGNAGWRSVLEGRHRVEPDFGQAVLDAGAEKGREPGGELASACEHEFKGVATAACELPGLIIDFE